MNMNSEQDLEQGGSWGAGDEHEDVVGGRVHVWRAPGLDGEAVGAGSEDEVVAGGHVGLVEREGLVGVVGLEDPVERRSCRRGGRGSRGGRNRIGVRTGSRWLCCRNMSGMCWGGSNIKGLSMLRE